LRLSRITPTLIAAIALLGSTGPSALARYVGPLVKQHDFFGVILITGRDGTLARDGFGNTAPLGAAYAIGSISKTFTAAAIELLASRGKLRYSDTLEKYVPEYRYAKDITIDELLGHSAGVPDYYALPNFASVREKSLSLPQIARWLNTFPLDFKPGTKGRYSNSGYSLLALVIERASGESYGKFLADNLFTTLGLKHTSANASPSDVTGYDPGPPPSSVQPAAHLGEGWLIGPGSIRSNADDLSHWLDVAAAGTYVNFKDLPYPYGWSKHAGSSILEQDGRIPGFASDVSIDEATGLKVIVLSNVQCAVVTMMAHDLRRAYSSSGNLPRVTLRPEYNPTLAELSAVTGYYGVPGLPLVVSVNRSYLMLANANDGMQLPLDPVGPNRFFFRPLYAYVTFNKDAKGIAQSIDWAGKFTIPRLPATP
jgi:CubicO group peptidase (beta-lactamase class C family)